MVRLKHNPLDYKNQEKLHSLGKVNGFLHFHCISPPSGHAMLHLEDPPWPTTSPLGKGELEVDTAFPTFRETSQETNLGIASLRDELKDHWGMR